MLIWYSNGKHSYQPVARGALLRFEDIKARNIKTDEHFGIAQVESFNKYIHTDATIKSGRVQIDDFDGSRIVFERWCPLTKTVCFYWRLLCLEKAANKH